MTDKLSREEVLHVAHLARININDAEIEKYRVQLKELLDEVDKIKDVTNYDKDMMITPVKEEIKMRPDVEKDTISFSLVRDNIPHTSGNLIEVPVMIHE